MNQRHHTIVGITGNEVYDFLAEHTFRVHCRLVRAHTVYMLYGGLPCLFNQLFILFNNRLVHLNCHLARIRS